MLITRLVTGRHKFVPPDFEAGDQRGPCPGLNALANHNYIPHDGVVNVRDLTRRSDSNLLTLIFRASKSSLP